MVRLRNPTPVVKQKVIAVLAALLAVIPLIWMLFPGGGGRLPSRQTPSPLKPPLGGQTLDAATSRKFLALEASQNELDRTVWAAELQAETHEDVFIRLWDNLRQTKNAESVLSRFPFGELRLGKPGAAESIGHGITATQFAGEAKRLAPSDWRQLLAGFRAAGFQLEQSDWRHPRFEPGTNGPARSTIAMTLHAIQPSQQRRVIVRGNLRVEWDADGGEDGQPFPRVIDASDLELLERVGDPVFENVVAKEIEPDPETTTFDPVIVFDLDGDGLSEIILSAKNTVFWNRGGGDFEPRKLCEFPAKTVLTAVVADFDNDSFPDLLAADHDGLLLFIGAPRGAFPARARRISFSSRPLPNPFLLTAGDVDGDDDLDVWLAQYKQPYLEGQMPTPYYDANDGFPAYLLINDGQGRFSDRTEAAGLATKRFRRTYSSSFVDLDDDGDLDLIVVSDFAGMDAHLNDGTGHFTDATGPLFGESHAFGMAHTFGDYDLDGRLDLLVIGMNSFVGQRLDALGLGLKEFPVHQAMRPKMAFGNRLYFGRGEKFQPTPAGEDVARTGWSWGATTFDFDNDGAQDIYIANGHKSRDSARDYERQFWRHDIHVGTSEHDSAMHFYFRAVGTRLYGQGQSYGGYEKNRFFINRRRGQGFLEVGYLFGLALELDCRNVVSDDLDGDGRVDLIVTTQEEWPSTRRGLFVFHNRTPNPGNWIGVRVREEGKGLSPVGAKVIVRSRTSEQTRWIVTGDSYRSQHAATAHFGIGAADEITAVEVRRPNGFVQRIANPAINRYHEVHIRGK